jgi:hypothetical protein
MKTRTVSLIIILFAAVAAVVGVGVWALLGVLNRRGEG